MRRIALLMICLIPSSGFASGEGDLVATHFFQSSVEWPAAPVFSEIENVREKKEQFFDFLAPKITHANAEILKARAFLLKHRTQLSEGQSLDASVVARIKALSALCKVASPSVMNAMDITWDKLLQRVDTLPVSLVLAQAANESGWGTSRFALDGNNFFGVWCYVEGCGLKPKQRDQGATHEVKRYASIYDSVTAYIHNINTNSAYTDLRAIRMSLRGLNTPSLGSQLAEGLRAYSVRGEAYVREIQAMIRSNRLEQRSAAEQV